ncbi:hypothetical protein AVEN_907-1, partial [Araneus ventricosus]
RTFKSLSGSTPLEIKSAGLSCDDTCLHCNQHSAIIESDHKNVLVISNLSAEVTLVTNSANSTAEDSSSFGMVRRFMGETLDLLAINLMDTSPDLERDLQYTAAP